MVSHCVQINFVRVYWSANLLEPRRYRRLMPGVIRLLQRCFCFKCWKVLRIPYEQRQAFFMLPASLGGKRVPSRQICRV